jgi:hypothetical protein
MRGLTIVAVALLTDPHHPQHYRRLPDRER